jgi:hypothetical protein
MNNRNYIFLLGLCAVISLSAKMVEFVEDAYLLQAPAEIVKIVQDLADEQHVVASYEVAIPKKAGMQINPWNEFIAVGVNPSTNNKLLVINPTWWTQLTLDEQKYIITRAFWNAHTGSSLPLIILSLILSVISILSIILLTIGLGKYRKTSHLKRWLRIVIAFIIMWLINTFIVSHVHLKIATYLANHIDHKTHELALAKSGLTQKVAIASLTKLDNAIKENLKSGELFWKPFEKLYEKQIETIKNS